MQDTYQLFSEGNLDLILESCPDYWNGTGLGHLNENVEKRILEFCQNSILGDGFVVAYSYRPIPSEVITKVQLQVSNMPFYIELPPESEKIYDKILASEDPTDSPYCEAETSVSLNHLTHKTISSLSTRNRLISKRSTISQIDNKLAGSFPEESFLREVVKNQTFLGLASFFFPIKPVNNFLTKYKNVIDFIEDLGLAGVRFVYFSSAPQRESKGKFRHA